MRKPFLTFSILYFIVAVLWLISTDLVVLSFANTFWQLTVFQHLKDFLFILATTLGFYFFSKRTFRLRQESESQYQQLFEDNPQPMFIFRKDDLLTLEVNKAAIKKYGYSRQDFLKMQLHALRLSKDDSELKEALATPYPGELLTRHRKKSGAVFYVQVSFQKINFRGQESHLIMAQDIDAEHRGSKKINRLNHRLKNIRKAISASSLALSLNREGKINFINKTFLNLLKLKPEKVLHTSYTNLCSSLSSVQLASISRHVQQGKIWKGELKILNQEHHLFCIDTKVVPVKDEQENIEEYVIIGYDITEKKQAQEELIRREKLFSSLIDSQTNYLVRIDLGGHYTYANNRFLQKFGYTLNELTGTHYYETAFSEDVDKCREAEKFCIENPEQIIKLEIRKADKEGNIFWNIWEFVGIAGKDGRTTVIQGLGQDITQQRTAEKDLQKYTRRLNLVLDSIGEGFFTVDKNWRLLRVNREFERMIGKSKEELQNGYLLEVLPFMAIPPFYPYLEAALEEGKNTGFEEYASELNKWLEVNLYPFQDGISGYIRDVTYRKKAELELKQTLQRYNTLSKATYDTIWEWDLIRNTLKWNEGMNRIFHYADEEIENTHEWWEARLHPQDRERVSRDIFKHIAEKKGAWSTEYRFKTADNEYHFVLDRGYVIYDENQEPVRMIGAIQDIHQQRQFQEEIQKLSLVARKTQNGVVITDKDGYIEWTNESFTSLCGYQLEEVKGKKPGQFLQGPQTQPKIRESIRRMLQLKVDFSEEIINYHKSGIPYWVRMDISPVFDEQGELIKFIGIETDITERKKFEQRLQQQNDQLKEIAWISSHEIRGPVASILGLISLYNHSCPETPFNKEILQHLEEVTKKLDVVIHRIVNKTYAVDEMQEKK